MMIDASERQDTIKRQGVEDETYDLHLRSGHADPLCMRRLERPTNPVHVCDPVSLLDTDHLKPNSGRPAFADHGNGRCSATQPDSRGPKRNACDPRPKPHGHSSRNPNINGEFHSGRLLNVHAHLGRDAIRSSEHANPRMRYRNGYYTWHGRSD